MRVALSAQPKPKFPQIYTAYRILVHGVKQINCGTLDNSTRQTSHTHDKPRATLGREAIYGRGSGTVGPGAE